MFEALIPKRLYDFADFKWTILNIGYLVHHFKGHWQHLYQMDP